MDHQSTSSQLTVGAYFKGPSVLIMIEGWHNRINQNVHGAGLNMYELILRLHHEALDVVLTCKLVEEEVLKRMQRTKYRHCHEKIMEFVCIILFY